ncbi:MAG: hypothetical protein Q8865_00130 [Bacillota bacterium]|nr:hypothetical protein [Bacillota bacterium]
MYDIFFSILFTKNAIITLSAKKHILYRGDHTNNCLDEIPLISASIAIALAKSMTADQLNLYGNLIAAIGAEMMTIAAARQTASKE